MFGARPATLLAVLLLHFCSVDRILNATAPVEGIATRSGIAYAAGPRHELDVYTPKQHAAPLPVVVFFYGGGWTSGDKAMYRFVGEALANAGLVAVVPDYRLYPEVQFPAFVQDAAQAVAWTRAHAAQFGGDPRRLFLMGHSAGAQIAALLALDPEYLAAVGLSPRRDVCGMIGLAGPYDFLPFADPAVNAIFGPAASWPRAQPITFATAQAPRMLLLAGQIDRTIDPGNTLRLAARLRAMGAQADAALYPDVSHSAIVDAFAAPLTFVAPVRDEVVRFVAGPCTGAGTGRSAASALPANKGAPVTTR
jgi:acetyl esterase/lipase